MIDIDLKHTALLVMDLQADIVARFADKLGPLLERSAGVVAAARKAELPVIYVVVGFRAGYPEISPKNASFSAVSQSGRLIVTSPPGTDIDPAVKPEAGDVVVVKHRVNAFAGTDLDMILRAKGIDTLLLLGIATSGVVLSTLRHAADADYRSIVISDCCADADEEVHRVLTEKVFPRQASVVVADEVNAALKGA